VENSNKVVSGKGINERHLLKEMNVGKGKQTMDATTFINNSKEDGTHQLSTNTFASLSRAIGGALDGERLISSKSSGGASSHAKPLGRDSDRENCTSELKTTFNGGYCSSESPAKSSAARSGACPGATQLGY
ncbi:hypothetical protein MKX01_031259, partial [Papaver californicum]